MSETEEQRLEREIAERLAALDALRAPMTRAEAAELARSNPDEFNRRVDAIVAAGGAWLKEDDE